MTYDAKLMCGIILITVPTIEYGGYFLLTILSGKQEKLGLTTFQKAMFRAGHAHAGVIVILSLICQILADYAALATTLVWIVRVGVPAAALLMSGGFFAAAAGKGSTQPNQMIGLIYVGAIVLTASLILLGIGLIVSE